MSAARVTVLPSKYRTLIADSPDTLLHVFCERDSPICVCVCMCRDTCVSYTTSLLYNTCRVCQSGSLIPYPHVQKGRIFFCSLGTRLGQGAWGPGRDDRDMAGNDMGVGCTCTNVHIQQQAIRFWQFCVMSATTATKHTSAAKEGTDPPTPHPKPPAPTPEPPAPPTPVLEEDEVKQMRDLGLGRGVDGTNQTPWLSKSSFQVRDVAITSIMGTDEGGSLQSYVKDVSSVRSRQSTLTASIQIPKAPVTIGVDGEYSRSYNTSKKSIGQKVMNRTVSFKAVFDDLSTDHTQSKTPPGKAEGEGAVSTHYSFEERLCKWILDEVRGDPKPPTKAAEIQPVPEATPKPPPQPTPQPQPPPQPKPQPEPTPQPQPQPTPQPSTSPVEELAAFLKTATAEELKAIDEQCSKFVEHFRNTHYVSAIELGAARYQVLEDDEYYGKLGGGAKLQVDKFGSGNFTASTSWKKAVKNSSLSTIGLMTQQGTRWVVARNDEAVIGVKIQPISNLVRLPQLKTSLQTALVNYMKQQQDDRGTLITTSTNIHTCNVFVYIATCSYLVMTTSVLIAQPHVRHGEDMEKQSKNV